MSERSFGLLRLIRMALRYAALPGALTGLAVLTGPPALAQGGDCLSEECFFSSRVREFQLVDRDTLVVYVGRDRCAFVVNVTSLFCDLTYLPEVEFFRTRDRMRENRMNPGRDDELDRGAARRTSIDDFGRNERICPYNADDFSLETFGFTTIDEEDMPRGRPACEVTSVAPASDNDLIEMLTLEGIAAPPPPVGNGEITRAD